MAIKLLSNVVVSDTLDENEDGKCDRSLNKVKQHEHEALDPNKLHESIRRRILGAPVAHHFDSKSELVDIFPELVLLTNLFVIWYFVLIDEHSESHQ